MKIASFIHAGAASYGIVTDRGVIDAGKRLKVPTLKELLTQSSVDELKALVDLQPDYALDELTLLPTVPNPDKILCIGVNYATHLAESGHPTPPHPMIFTRFANSQVGSGQPMIRPLESERFDMLLKVRQVLTTDQWHKLREIIRQRRERGEEPGGEAGRRPLRKWRN